jgi:hypothetical protein
MTEAITREEVLTSTTTTMLISMTTETTSRKVLSKRGDTMMTTMDLLSNSRTSSTKNSAPGTFRTMTMATTNSKEIKTSTTTMVTMEIKVLAGEHQHRAEETTTTTEEDSVDPLGEKSPTKMMMCLKMNLFSTSLQNPDQIPRNPRKVQRGTSST